MRLSGADLRVDGSDRGLVVAASMVRDANHEYEGHRWADTAICVSSDGGRTFRRETAPRANGDTTYFADVLWSPH